MKTVCVIEGAIKDYFEFQRNRIETSVALLFYLKKESNVRLQILQNDAIFEIKAPSNFHVDIT